MLLIACLVRGSALGYGARMAGNISFDMIMDLVPEAGLEPARYR